MAGWCFFAAGDKDIEAWITGHARRILQDRAGIVAAAIRRKATTSQGEARHLVKACMDATAPAGAWTAPKRS